MRTTTSLIIAAVVIALACLSVVFVDEAEMVIVTQFGRPVATYDTAGLRWKLPYQSTIRIDRRLQIYDPRPSEFLAQEKKTVNLDVFVLWRVDEESPRKFYETVGDRAGAEPQIHDIVWSELAAEVGRSPLETIVSIDSEEHQVEKMMEGVTARCDGRAEESYGIHVVDVRLKRIAMPAQVRDSVFQRMREERKRMAKRYRAEGEEEATKIRAAADKQRTVILAEAYAQSEKVRGKAEAQAIEVYAAAHQQDPQFYELLRTLEAYRKFLDEKTTVLLSADSELLKYLTGKPDFSAGSAPAGPSGGGPMVEKHDEPAATESGSSPAGDTPALAERPES